MKRTVLVATLLLMLVAGCSCPPVGGGQGGRNRDTSDVTFAFFGGLRCLFGEPSQPEESREIADSDLKTAGSRREVTQTATLTIR